MNGAEARSEPWSFRTYVWEYLLFVIVYVSEGLRDLLLGWTRAMLQGWKALTKKPDEPFLSKEDREQLEGLVQVRSAPQPLLHS